MRPPESRSGQPSPVAQSANLVDAPPIRPATEGRGTHAPAEAAAVAQTIGALEVPLPPGLDAAANLRWESQNQGQPIAEDDMRFLLQHNAACDWLRFAATNDLTDDQRTIVEQLPDWSALRGGLWTEKFLRPIVADVLAGNRAAVEVFVTTGPGKPVPPSPAPS